MKRNNSNDLAVSTIVLRTPVNPKPPVWSPIFHATTPDLNAHDSGCKGTPALIRSLGINPDLDTSWSSMMATPTNTESSLLGIKNLDSLDNPDDKPKLIQRRHLFPVVPNEENFTTEVWTENGKQTHEVVSYGQWEPEILPSDVLSFLKKPPSKFIYPDPIYINNNGTTNLSFNSSNNSKHQQSTTNMEHLSSPTVTQHRRRNLKEKVDFTNNRKFNNGRESTSPSVISVGTEPQPSIIQETKEDTFSPNIETPVKAKVNWNVKRSYGSNCPTPSHLAELSTTANTAAQVFNTEPSTLDILDDVKLHDPSSAFGYPNIAGFSTASGKEVAVSKEAITRAKNIFSEFEEEPLLHTKVSETVGFRGNKEILPTVAIGSAQAFLQDIDVKIAVDVQASKSRVMSTSVNKKGGNIFKPPAARTKSPFKEINEVKFIPPIKMQFAGFSTASGKNVAISEEAIIRANALFESVDLENSQDGPSNTTMIKTGVSTSPVKLEPFPKMRVYKEKNIFHSVKEGDTVPVEIPRVVGFNTASGKNIQISESALSRAQNLYEEMSSITEIPESIELLKSSTREKQRSLSNTTMIKSDVSISATKLELVSKMIESKAKHIFHTLKEDDTVPVEIPRTVGFNTASGKNIQISESALSRAQNLYEEMSSVTELPQTIEMLKTSTRESQSRKSPPLVLVKENSVDKQRKTEEFDDHNDDGWVSSPTIGKKKKNTLRKEHLTTSPQIQLPMTPILGTPSTFDDVETFVPVQVLAMRRIARQEQKLLIQSKLRKNKKTSPKAGYLYQLKKDTTRPKKTMRELLGDTPLPEICAPYILVQNYGMLTSVCLVEASNASSFSFFAWEHFSVEECRKNVKGIQLGEFVVILSDDNTIGCEEIEASLLASKNVDPTLVSSEWIRNHYRWIVWKLASMEQRMPALFARSCLTPKNVLEQLKYRYDREIDNCQRSALKRIIEQDDTPAKMMILCVVEIRTPNILELTDGWYSIEAHCDQALMEQVGKKKIFVGVKLAISGAELISPGPTTPLEKDSGTHLKISANSTRRARWDSKLGFYSTPLPFPIKLTSVLADGGIVSHVRVDVIRIYPMVYMEKTTDGKTIFHGERQYRRISENTAMRYEHMMEKIVEDIEREEDEQDRKRTKAEGGRHHTNSNLTDEEKRSRVHAEVQKRMQANIKSMEGVPMLKLRVVDWRATDSISAIVSIWRPNEELQHLLKEGRAYNLYNVNAAGIRVGELQFNAMKNTSWNEIKNHTPTSLQFERRVTSFHAANQNGFKPIFNELDVVGLVVYVAQQQTKGPFEAVVLSDGTNYFGVKCWSSLEQFALADVIVVGEFLAFSNLQWRATASRTVSKLPFAFIHESTLVSARPAQKYLDVALQDLKQSLRDPAGCVTEAEVQLNALLGSSTPQSATPKYVGIDARRSGGAFTPTGIPSCNGKKNDTPTTSSVTMNRARLLEKYGAPPALSPWSGNPSPHVRKKFKPPARKSIV